MPENAANGESNNSAFHGIFLIDSLRQQQKQEHPTPLISMQGIIWVSANSTLTRKGHPLELFT
tara:strand:- start:492 stop:680 length:189 start_codon:yes stop_codon:yes gene_type:complete